MYDHQNDSITAFRYGCTEAIQLRTKTFLYETQILAFFFYCKINAKNFKLHIMSDSCLCSRSMGHNFIV